MARKMLKDGDVPMADGDQYDYDLFVIGAGSGGVRGSRTAASFGAKVAICELPFHPISSEWLGGHGGTCVIRGCVPKKILVYGSSFKGEFEDAKNFGWEVNGDINFNWKTLLENKTKEIVRLNGVHQRILSNAGVTMIEGAGSLVDAHTVEVTQQNGSKQRYTAKHVLIATGSRAKRINIPGKELSITSDEALSLEELPKRAVILGGGYIAVEFASIWKGMGAEVDLFYRKDLPLRGFDDEMRTVVASNLEGRGIRLHPGTSLSELSKTADGIKVATDKGEELIADVVLFATGRTPNSQRLNLEAVGVEVDQIGAIKVDEYSRTSVPNIWAVGDVTNRINLTPVALMEATCFAKTVFGGQPTKPDHRDVPCAVFSCLRTMISYETNAAPAAKRTARKRKVSTPISDENLRRSKRIVKMTDGCKAPTCDGWTTPKKASTTKTKGKIPTARRANMGNFPLPNIISDVEFPTLPDLERGEPYPALSVAQLQLVATSRCGVPPLEVSAESLLNTDDQDQSDSTTQQQLILHG